MCSYRTEMKAPSNSLAYSFERHEALRVALVPARHLVDNHLRIALDYQPLHPLVLGLYHPLDQCDVLGLVVRHAMVGINADGAPGNLNVAIIEQPVASATKSWAWCRATIEVECADSAGAVWLALTSLRSVSCSRAGWRWASLSSVRTWRAARCEQSVAVSCWLSAPKLRNVCWQPTVLGYRCVDIGTNPPRGHRS